MQTIIKKIIVISYVLLLGCSIVTYADERLIENTKGQDVQLRITVTDNQDFVTAHFFIRDNHHKKLFLLTSDTR